MNHGSTIMSESVAPFRSEGEAVWALAEYAGQERHGVPVHPAGVPHDRAALKQATIDARVALEEAVMAATVAAQRAISYAELLDEVLVDLQVPVQEEERRVEASARPQSALAIPVEVLSPRERQVLALVAEGRSNKAIAETLFVSPNTIKTHISSLFGKLHADTRAQLAAMAARAALHGSL